MGKKLIVGNWKMNLNVGEASMFVLKLTRLTEVHNDVEAVLAPTALALQTVSLQIDRRQFKLASQNHHWRDEGPYTGEISANQLRGIVQYAIVGHSERRHIFGETDKDIRMKIQSAYRNGLKPILCVGETAIDRAEGETNSVIQDQIAGGLGNVTSEEAEDLAIAYEPVWAVGTGRNAMPEDVVEVAKMIRSQLKHLFGAKIAKNTRILYGGSVSVDNAMGYLKAEGIDGLLIGGVSLDSQGFSTIVNRAHDVSKEGEE